MVRVTFQARVGEELRSEPDPADVLQFWLTAPRLTCCTMQAGFHVSVAGVNWADSIDELWMTMTWLYAVESLLNGAPQVHATPWEESSMTLARTGEGSMVRMADIHHSGSVVSPPVEVPLETLAREMLRAGRELERLQTEVLARLASAAPPPEADQTIRANLQPDLTALLDRIEWMLDRRT